MPPAGISFTQPRTPTFLQRQYAMHPETVAFDDVCFLVNKICQENNTDIASVAERLFRQFANPPGLYQNFPERVCVTPVVRYANSRSRPAQEHLGRQMELAASALRLGSPARDPFIVVIEGVNYVKCDAIMTTSTCPIPGAYDLLHPGI